jgi:ABC-type antimicrobial peptide transport system permease subunit
VGVTNEVSGHNYDIYVPKSPDINYAVNQIGYTVGTAKLANGGAADFYSEAAPLLPDRMRLTIYDQGYAKTKESFGNLLQISKIVTVICMLASFAIIMLFCFLFVYRQKDVSELMIKLGAGRKRTSAYFLFGAGIISLSAGAAGSAAAYGLSKVVIRLLSTMAFNQAVSYSRYSNSSSSIVKELIYTPHSGYSFFVYAALGIAACILLCVLLFVINTFKDKNKKRKKIKKSRHIKQGHIFKISGRSLKYAVVSILRGGARTLVVPMAAMAVILFLCHLANTYGGYRDELHAIEESTEITGMFTDIYGKQVKNAVVEAYQLKDMYNAGYLKELNVSRSTPYGYWGKYEKDSKVLVQAAFRLPKNSYALETFLDNMLRSNYLVSTNGILSCPEFFFSDKADITFHEGYDESIFGQAQDGVLCCVVSTDFMEKYGIELGDRIRLFVYRDYFVSDEPETDMKVVGSYEKQGTKDNIYCQLAEYINPGLIFDNGSEDNEELFDYTFDSASFTLADTSKLDEFKDFLSDYGFSTPHMISKYRNFLVLEDEKFNSSLGTLKQQIRYVNVLYPVLYALVAIISVVVSYLLVMARRKEFAIMRGLGAEKKTTFKSFFFEQIMLCVLGAVAGVVLSVLIYGSVNAAGIILTGGFVICYTLGCALSIGAMNNKPVLAVLKYED